MWNMEGAAMERRNQTVKMIAFSTQYVHRWENRWQSMQIHTCVFHSHSAHLHCMREYGTWWDSVVHIHLYIFHISIMCNHEWVPSLCRLCRQCLQTLHTWFSPFQVAYDDGDWIFNVTDSHIILQHKIHKLQMEPFKKVVVLPFKFQVCITSTDKYMYIYEGILLKRRH